MQAKTVSGIQRIALGNSCMHWKYISFYHLQEYGNLPTAPAYRINMGDTRWELRCQLPVANKILPVYRTQNRTLKDCDAFARDMAKLENASVDSTIYYQDFAYYILIPEKPRLGCCRSPTMMKAMKNILQWATDLMKISLQLTGKP